MIADSLPEAMDYVFVAGALPEAGLHRIAIAGGGAGRHRPDRGDSRPRA